MWHTLIVILAAIGLVLIWIGTSWLRRRSGPNRFRRR